MFPLGFLREGDTHFSLHTVSVRPSTSEGVIILFVTALVSKMTVGGKGFRSQRRVVGVITQHGRNGELVVRRFLGELGPPLVLVRRGQTI